MTVRKRHHNAAAHREELADQVNTNETDISTNTNDISTLQTQSPTIGTPVDLTNSGSDDLTSVDFAGVPSWANMVIFSFDGLSTSGTSDTILQIGDSGGIEDSGYTGASATPTGGTVQNYSAGFRISVSISGASVCHGAVMLFHLGGNVWSAVINTGFSNAATFQDGAGTKTLSDTLTQVRITTVGGSDTFDGGTANILYL